MHQAGVMSGIPMAETVALAFRQKRKVITALLVPPVLAIVFILVSDTIYRAQTELMVKTGREYLAEGDGESPQSAPTTTKLEGLNSEIELLTSRPVIQETIDQIGLPNLYPGLLENPPWFSTIADAAVKKFGQDLDVQVVKMTNLISVTFDATSQEKAIRVLDRLIAVYQARHAAVFAGGRSGSYEEAIRRGLDELQKLERKRTQIKLDNHIYDIAQQRAALVTQRVDAEAHLQDSIGRKATLEGRIAYLRDAHPKVPETTRSTNTEKTDEMVHARVTLTDLQQTEASLAARYAPGNPDLLRVRQQIATLQHGMASLRDEATRVAVAPSPLAQQVDQELIMDGAELSPLDGEIARDRNLIATIGEELQRLEGADMDLRAIDTQIDALNDSLKTLQGNLQQARSRDEMDRSRLISVVQVAMALAPDKPAQPKKALLIGGGLLAGILLAAGTVVASIVTSSIVAAEQGLERLLGLPVLGALPLVIHPRQSTTPLLLE